ncbi:hypothetical protein [Halogeometricum limi]|uniref:DUF8060 domain-containing protein n=1 Tax=Halogeometricum limi TaxID=555875 RepID=A0A1I6HHM0_9EURY|nr:hypothetical protein [Halogeometricum limi]SFR53787.1 hypothetical protein SAMN04488124_2239 [Halogeometricum limi]
MTTETADDETDDANREQTSSDAGGSGEAPSTVQRLTTALNYAVLGGLLLLAAVSAVQLYAAIGRTVTTFVVPEYRAPVMAAFNLAVLLVAALGISLQLRRLTGDETVETGR